MRLSIFHAIIFNILCLNSAVDALTSVTENRYDAVTNMIELSGYPVESHQVQTKDGYILKMQRIPPTMKSANGRPATIPDDVGFVDGAGDGDSSAKNKYNRKAPVLLMHGLFCSSSTWTIMGPDKALAYILSDAGYDVWLGNARGTSYSRKNIYHDPESREFWDFSWHEIGLYDLPSKINYILEKTNSSKLHYVGHSQGWTSFLVMLSMRPQYNKKILSSHGLAPVAFLGRMPNPLIQNLARLSKDITTVVNNFHVYEIVPTSPLIKMAGKILCDDTTSTQELCVNALFSIVGFNSDQLNRSVLPYLFEHVPASVSWKQIVHYGQLVQSKKFQMFDLGSVTQNVQTYGKSKPPQYNLSAIAVPIALYYGTADRLLASEDVQFLAKKLKRNIVSIARIEGWNHADFFIAIDVDKVVYKPIVENMNEADKAYMEKITTSSSELKEI